MTKSMQSHQGLYTVEFALVAGVFFFFLFAVFEVGRLFYSWNVLTEISRRTVRLAVVCDMDQSTLSARSDMIEAAVEDAQNLLPNLSSSNIQIDYLGFDGTTATTFSEIRLVRASIVNYSFSFLIPGLSITLNSPNFAATLPRESLGVTRYNYTTCQASA